jgi:hypothetical protein
MNVSEQKLGQTDLQQTDVCARACMKDLMCHDSQHLLVRDWEGNYKQGLIFITLCLTFLTFKGGYAVA